MALDSKNLGRLRRVADPRSVWSSEAGDFTPWLAENIDVLAQELGMTLTVVTTEVAVGEFWLDIQAEDENGRTVVIENQLERTDHGHLGQNVVYAAGLDATAVVWVATRFREDHRSALDWLNERTDNNVGFFGVEVSVVQIGDDGPRAPVFTVVSRPNDWQKSVKSAGGADAETANPVNTVRQDFFAEVLTTVNAQRPGIRVPARSRYNWTSFAFGPFGNWGLSIANGKLRIEAYLDLKDRDVTKQLFDQFATERAHWEARVGAGAFSWERLDDKRASRIAIYHPLDLDDEQQRQEAEEWAVTTLIAMYDALNEPLRSAANTVRASAITRDDFANDFADVPTREVPLP
ncbi:DUF4268 domain-containing protein [Rhodococcus ruber]|uniref:DUF4268 domain-containing protein n=1 Tax=Rhodococcus ruber TaxID=1830 RepID=UPI00387DD644